MIRRISEATAVLATFVALIATSPPPPTCAVETITVLADTTCGPAANVVLSSASGCGVTATGASFVGLPASGRIDYGPADAGLRSGFTLSGAGPDGGRLPSCEATPADGGFTVVCGGPCADADAGCPGFCSGTLTPQ